MRNSKRNKEMKVVHHWSPKPSLPQRVDNKRPASVAAILLSGDCLSVSGNVQLICLVWLLNMNVNLSVMMTEFEENLCVREDRDCYT